MFIRNLVRCATMAALLGTFSTFGAKAAEPQVLVSLPPLHSLVTKLLQGVATPQLLMTKDVAGHVVDLSGARDSGSEKRRSGDLGWTGKWKAPSPRPNWSCRTYRSKPLTLSKSIPFPGLASAKNPDRPTGERDPRFWLDPRLVHMALHVIAPGPGATSIPRRSTPSFDNEIALMNEVHHVEHSIRAEDFSTDDSHPSSCGNG